MNPQQEANKAITGILKRLAESTRNTFKELFERLERIEQKITPKEKTCIDCKSFQDCFNDPKIKLGLCGEYKPSEDN